MPCSEDRLVASTTESWIFLRERSHLWNVEERGTHHHDLLDSEQSSSSVDPPQSNHTTRKQSEASSSVRRIAHFAIRFKLEEDTMSTSEGPRRFEVRGSFSEFCGVGFGADSTNCEDLFL